MKKILLTLFTISSSLLTISSFAQVSTMLNIPPRIQWPNNNGYCGENSIQMCGLYYGDYISEGLCRNVAGSELLIYVNDTIALDKLSFTYTEWDPNPPSPQYTSYLDWVKQYLNKKQPVIIVVYINGLSDPDYDHIIPAIGFRATSVNTYTASDSLTYNSNFDTTPFTRRFSTIYDTRSMKANGATYSYCIPQNVDYGVAVTGNKDPGHVTRPVHIVLDSNDEPNVSLGAKARMMKAKVIADSLTIGKGYALLRYNNYKTVPSTGFSPLNASSTVYFTAGAVTKTVVDSFMSDTAVFYRCIPYVSTGIEEVASDCRAIVYPNPNNGQFTIESPEISGQSSVEVYNVIGEKIYDASLPQTPKGAFGNINLSTQAPGVYFYKIISAKGELIASGKFVIE
jgi:hypothetical protein